MNEIPIIMYHSVNNHPEDNPLGFLSISAREFSQHLKYFEKNGFKYLTLSELWSLACNDDLGEGKFVVLTFDDGYLDNYLIAADVLREYNAKATIFINPDFVIDSPARTLQQVPNAWGNLNFSELQILQRNGIFEIQSHSMTHDYEFCSDKVVDFYTSEKYKKYYWLAWKLFPDEKPYWCQRLQEYERRLPAGYPIFEYDRAITTKRFNPSDEFVKLAETRFSKKGSACIESLNNVAHKGTFETEHQWADRTKYELAFSKKLLEEKLDKKIEFICFPGGAYDEKVLELAENIGYKAYMLSSQKKVGSNLQRLKMACKTNKIIGLLRLSFTKDYPTFLRNRLFYYLNCKWKIESYMGNSSAKSFLQVSRKIRNLLTKLK